MPQFIQDADYDMQVRQEILFLLKGLDNANLLRAEGTAIAQIKNWLSGRYNVATIFAATGDARDQFLLTTCIDLALYHLYSQTGHKDIPLHRVQRYQDALDWLKMAGRGEIGTTLPPLTDEDGVVQGEAQIFSLNKPENQRW